MKEQETSFLLKGERSYVHGTSIYDDLLKVTGRHSFDRLDITFKKPILNTACTWFFADSEEGLAAVSDGAPCFGWYTAANDTTYFTLSSKQEKSPSQSIAYDEDRICKYCELAEEAAQQKLNADYTFIENLVAMTKRFHNTHYPLYNGKWLFARLQIGSIPASVEDIAIKLESMIPQRLSKLQVLANDRPVGYIFFSAG